MKGYARNVCDFSQDNTYILYVIRFYFHFRFNTVESSHLECWKNLEETQGSENTCVR